jgi:hypothetical protein
MHITKIDLKHGSASVDAAPISVEGKGALAGSIANYVRDPSKQMRGEHNIAIAKSQCLRKSADGVIEVGEGRVWAVTFLFDLIEFFESSVLEPKVLKACEKSLKFVSSHPSTAFLDSCEWGRRHFFMMLSKAI